jgi:MFS family permease
VIELSTDEMPQSAAESEVDDVSNLTYFQSVRRVLSVRNWRVYLISAWVYNSMVILQSYYNLYFRDIGFSYILTGALTSVLFGISLLGTIFSGYLADNYDRRKLSVFTMFINGVGFFFLAFTTDYLLVMLGLIISGLSAFTAEGGIAYHMSQVDRRLSGVANSLFTLGNSMGLIPLVLFAGMLSMGFGFVQIMQFLFVLAGVAYLIAAMIRAFVLESIPQPKRAASSESIIKDFLSENVRGLRLIVRVFPMLVAIVCFDAFSDSWYRFASTYFVNETLNFGLAEINLMFLITLLFSIPIAMYLGRVFDKHGGRRLTIVVYAVMPIAISLLILAQYVPYIAPQEWLNAADSVYPGLSVIFSLAFLATAMKQTNDILWFNVLGIYIIKSLPRSDLGKMLSLTKVMVFAFVAIGPIPAGFIYTYWQGLPLLYTTLFVNIIILIILMTQSFEPRVSVEELERESDALHTERS